MTRFLELICLAVLVSSTAELQEANLMLRRKFPTPVTVSLMALPSSRGGCMLESLWKDSQSEPAL